MNIIKLNAIDSTNSYIKENAVKNNFESFTVVLAEKQTSGRGQLGTVWESEQGKNLTFSILIKFLDFKITQQFYLSMAVSLAVLVVLKKQFEATFYIKWPNDILADKDKVAGILIENSIVGNFIKNSVIGIGLNVNQTNFSKEIEHVTSLKNISSVEIDKEKLLIDVVNSIEYFVEFIYRKEFLKLKEMYMNTLYKYKIPAMFVDKNNTVFMGKIVNISVEGQLVIELENEKTRKFNLKEIKFASR
ncbi:biotin--[acetyl-CoA-carboxylase] ligase [Lutibacter maritimus]|uniref:BirA family transcriptional regulator, biotin operon repressor / biotin-[acetyl-CoA-carboxylase] ligase n=1 Tax=Lutibacter maritimus TaxID=593133 RepID=A0A1I6S9U5_9FLAO|nr:biotin--[acetyl-CoA-carboxylase] ligase [Lutibacter maritimus]SFS73660.1 BirA family transcriptional regulator, biotin operon repressor / biotin-[acetyl-CoA-carboxylase] ligase [Lutibacter maritimus]